MHSARNRRSYDQDNRIQPERHSAARRDADGEWLLEMLRERCGITSPKDGCGPQGQCGCCLALVDGQPKTTCAMPRPSRRRQAVVTLEGVRRTSAR